MSTQKERKREERETEREREKKRERERERKKERKQENESCNGCHETVQQTESRREEIMGGQTCEVLL